MSRHVKHPDYSACTFPPGGGDRCACGGVRHWHAVVPYGCDDCKECTEFVGVPLGRTEAQVRAQIAEEIRTERMRIKGRHIDAEITDQYDRGHLYGLSSAANIAEGRS